MAYSLSHRKPLSSHVGRRMIFTGPDGIKDNKVKYHANTKYIGENRPILGATSDLNYLWRPAPNRSFTAKRKHFYVGEIGWGIPELSFINHSRLQTNVNLKRGECCKAVEDAISHRYQNPWQPKPQILDLQGPNSRGSLAWNMAYHENVPERHSKWATAVRSLKNASMRFPSLPKLPQVTEKRNNEIIDTAVTTELAPVEQKEMDT
ncbi:protein SPMIP2 [Notamacropus eugenii]|uniref:protein SPMIP2 n=1 Tax=Notamacropus eugenii TaxID=9315 RepID=UPI003B670204